MPSTTSIHCADDSGSRRPTSPLKSLASYANVLCAPSLFTRPSGEGEPSPVCGNQNDQIRRNQGCPLEVPPCASNHDQPIGKFISPYTTNTPYAACPMLSLADTDVTCLSCKRLLKRVFPSRLSKRWRKSPASAKYKTAQNRIEAQHSVELLEFFNLLRFDATKSPSRIFLRRIAFNLHYSIESIFSLLRG